MIIYYRIIFIQTPPGPQTVTVHSDSLLLPAEFAVAAGRDTDLGAPLDPASKPPKIQIRHIYIYIERERERDIYYI